MNNLERKRKLSREYTKKHRALKKQKTDEFGVNFNNQDNFLNENFNFLGRSDSDFSEFNSDNNKASAFNDLNCLNKSDSSNSSNQNFNEDYSIRNDFLCDVNHETDSCVENDSEKSDLSRDSDYWDLSFSGNEEELLMENEKKNLKERLKEWSLENINTIRNKSLSELLNILRDEGHNDLPKTAETLLGTKHRRQTKDMRSKRGNMGKYSYCGLEEAIKKRIDPNIYNKDVIEVLVNVDGVPLYKNSKHAFGRY